MLTFRAPAAPKKRPDPWRSMGFRGRPAGPLPVGRRPGLGIGVTSAPTQQAAEWPIQARLPRPGAPEDRQNGRICRCTGPGQRRHRPHCRWCAQSWRRLKDSTPGKHGARRSRRLRARSRAALHIGRAIGRWEFRRSPKYIRAAPPLRSPSRRYASSPHRRSRSCRRDVRHSPAPVRDGTGRGSSLP